MMRIKGDISSMDTAKEMRTELVEMDQFSITITCECEKNKTKQNKPDHSG